MGRDGRIKRRIVLESLGVTMLTRGIVAERDVILERWCSDARPSRGGRGLAVR